MAGDVHTVAMEHQIPAGALGPEPVLLDARAYLMPYESGVILVDTGMDPGGRALDEGLARLGACWADVSHVLLTHAHRDHVGALDHVRASAPGAAVLASAVEDITQVSPLVDGDVIGPLRVVATPGHTAGHLSFLDQTRGVLVVGDCLGVVDGRLARAPERFTADADVAERTLRDLLAYRGARLLFAHGPELDDAWDQLDLLLDR